MGTWDNLRKSQFTDDSANWSCDLQVERIEETAMLPRRWSEKSQCRKPEESDWLTYWEFHQSWWFPKTWSPSGKIFKIAPQEQLVDPESRYISQYHLTTASLRACFEELSSQMTFGSLRANQSTTRRKIPHRYHSNFLAYLHTCQECLTTTRGYSIRSKGRKVTDSYSEFNIDDKWLDEYKKKI